MATSQDFATWTCGPLLRRTFLASAPAGDAAGSAWAARYGLDTSDDLHARHRIDPHPAPAGRRPGSRSWRTVWRRCVAIDALVDAIERQIDLLREHRQALITAAVTGQLDVAKAAHEAGRDARSRTAIEAWLLDQAATRSGDPRSVRPRARARSRPSCSRSSRRRSPTRGRSLSQRPRRRGRGAQPGFLKRLAAELDERGTVDVLRHGVKDHGVDGPARVLQARARADAGARRAVRREPARRSPASSPYEPARRRRSTCACS